MTKRIVLAGLLVALLLLAGCSKPGEGPGSDAWRTQTRAYVAVYAKANRAAVESLNKQSEALRSGSAITSDQAGHLMTGASEDLAKATKDLEAVEPPSELAEVHAAQLAFLKYAKDGVEKQAAGVQAGDTAMIAEGQTLLQKAQEAQNKAQTQLRAFMTKYNDQLK